MRLVAAALWAGVASAALGCSSDTDAAGERAGGSGGSNVGGTGGRAASSETGSGGAPRTGSGGDPGSSGGAAGGSSSTGGGSGNAAGGSGGTGTGGGSSGTGGSSGGGATFAQVREILTMSCAISMCHHNGGGNDNVDLRDTTGLLTRLLGTAPAKAETACKNRPIVVPGDPEGSLIVAMIEAPDGPRKKCGKQMPDDCPDKRDCLADADIQIIRDWISAGALDN